MMSGIQSKITMYGKKENVLYNAEKKISQLKTIQKWHSW